jgi:crossover junction endodeoxyribonuclease RusA
MMVLPWPPSSLSGHNKGSWHARSGIIAKHREWARNATLAARIAVPPEGDIHLVVGFYPPNRRSDRANFANRMKPYFDGIADALKVNDRRFVPSYQFGEPVKGGRVVVVLETLA